MNVFHNLVNAILVIVFIYALGINLRRKGTLTEDHSLTLARIVTDLCLPAIIFVSLARQTIQLDQMEPALSYTFIIPGGFMLALSYAGIFASILLLIYPSLMAWRLRYMRQSSRSYRVTGGKLGLVIALLFGFGIILLDIANQFDLLPMPKVE